MKNLKKIATNILAFCLGVLIGYLIINYIVEPLTVGNL